MSNSHPINIKAIKEVLFSIQEELVISDPDKIIKIELYHSIGVNTEFRSVKFLIGVYIHYPESQEKLASMEVNTFYELPNMDEYQMDGNNIVFPGEVLLDMVRESISHVRALFYQRLAGTPYQQVVLPLEDPAKITAHFFPSLIKNNKGEMLLKGVLEDR